AAVLRRAPLAPPERLEVPLAEPPGEARDPRGLEEHAVGPLHLRRDRARDDAVDVGERRPPIARGDQAIRHGVENNGSIVDALRVQIKAVDAAAHEVPSYFFALQRDLIR